jgi:hypothetical protein
MEQACCLVAPFALGLATPIERDSAADVCPCAHAGDGVLHLAVTPVAAVHRRGRRRQPRIVEAREGLVQVGAGARLEGRADRLAAGHPSAPLGQLLEGGRGPATAVKAAVDRVHDLPQRPPRRVPATARRPRLACGRAQRVLDEEVAVVEQVRDVRRPRVLGPSLVLRGLRCRTAAGPPGYVRGEAAVVRPNTVRLRASRAA